MKKDEKIPITLLLDRKVVKWITEKAEQEGTTLDEAVNHWFLCWMLVNSLDEEDFNDLRMVLRSKDNGELPS